VPKRGLIHDELVLFHYVPCHGLSFIVIEGLDVDSPLIILSGKRSNLKTTFGKRIQEGILLTLVRIFFVAGIKKLGGTLDAQLKSAFG
jgi:hypothetical protein